MHKSLVSAAFLALALVSASLSLTGCGDGGTPGTSIAAGSPISTLSTATVTFPGTPTGTTTAAQVVTLTNTGTATLYITSIALAGTNAAVFSETNTCGASLTAGSGTTAAASCNISITFSPGSTATATATVTVITNAAESPQTISLSGSGNALTSQCKTSIPRKSGPATTTNYAGSIFSGKVMAGTQPMIGSSVQLYAAGATGNGIAPTALGAPIVTDATGSFAIAAAYTCPVNLSTLYVVARGGKPGTTGATNTAAVMLAVLGTCNTVASTSKFVVNEATTVAGVYAFNQFLSAGGNIGGSSTNILGLQLAAGTAANLVNPTTGIGPGVTFPANGNPPTANLNALANALNACITGTPGTACTSLYAATSVSGTAPSNTLDATMNLVRQPAANVAALYTLSKSSAAYSPIPTAQPSDWTLFATYMGSTNAGTAGHAPSGLGIDSSGNVWVADYFSTVGYFSNTGSPLVGNGIAGNYLYEAYGLGIDHLDNAWVPDEQSAYSVNSSYGAVSVINTAGGLANIFSAGGLNFPVAISIDNGGTVWVVDYGNSHVTLYGPTGALISGANGYSSSQIAFPVAVAIDSNCYGYIGNQGSNTITRVAPDGSNFQSYTTGTGASGLAVDAANNVWTANYYGNSIGMLASNGTIVSSSLVGGGINHPQAIAIDGAGSVWIANYRGPSITELAGSSSTSPGTPLSPAAGFGPDAALLEAFAIAIDPSGNLWVSNFGNNTITEFIGMAVPVRTPVFGPPTLP